MKKRIPRWILVGVIWTVLFFIALRLIPVIPFNFAYVMVPLMLILLVGLFWARSIDEPWMTGSAIRERNKRYWYEKTVKQVEKEAGNATK